MRDNICFLTTTAVGAISIVKYNNCTCVLEDTKGYMVNNIKLADLRITRQFFKTGIFRVTGEYKLYELINAIYLCSKDAGIITDDVISSCLVDTITLTSMNGKIYVESNQGVNLSDDHVSQIEEYKDVHANLLKMR